MIYITIIFELENEITIPARIAETKEDVLYQIKTQLNFPGTRFLQLGDFIFDVNNISLIYVSETEDNGNA